jgi:hypothetical protein
MGTGTSSVVVARLRSNRYPDIGMLAEDLTMECEERGRLAQEYFSALDHQRQITAKLKELVESGSSPDLVKVAEIETETAIEKAYEAWHAFNEHQSAHQCGA